MDYYIRNVDPALWQKVKVRATSEGRTLRFVIVELLRIYAKHGYQVVETFDAAGDGKND